MILSGSSGSAGLNTVQSAIPSLDKTLFYLKLDDEIEQPLSKQTVKKQPIIPTTSSDRKILRKLNYRQV